MRPSSKSSGKSTTSSRGTRTVTTRTATTRAAIDKCKPLSRDEAIKIQAARKPLAILMDDSRDAKRVYEPGTKEARHYWAEHPGRVDLNSVDTAEGKRLSPAQVEAASKATVKHPGKSPTRELASGMIKELRAAGVKDAPAKLYAGMKAGIRDGKSTPDALKSTMRAILPVPSPRQEKSPAKITRSKKETPPAAAIAARKESRQARKIDELKRESAAQAARIQARKATKASKMKPVDPESIVKQALRHLAGSDTDRARERNDVGFNKFDSEAGHDLATKEKLTPAQVEAARKMLQKYNKQLLAAGIDISRVPDPALEIEIAKASKILGGEQGITDLEARVNKAERAARDAKLPSFENITSGLRDAWAGVRTATTAAQMQTDLAKLEIELAKIDSITRPRAESKQVTRVSGGNLGLVTFLDTSSGKGRLALKFGYDKKMIARMHDVKAHWDGSTWSLPDTADNRKFVESTFGTSLTSLATAEKKINPATREGKFGSTAVDITPVTMRDGKKMIRIESDKDLSLVAKIKDIPGYKWDSERMAWYIPAEHVADMERLIGLAPATPVPETRVPITITSSLVPLPTVRVAESTKVKLYPWQPEIAEKLIVALDKHGAAFDMSGTGVGKTYTAIAVAKEMGLKPLVITTAANTRKNKYEDAFKHFGVKDGVSINWELAREGKMRDANGETIPSPFIKKAEGPKEKGKNRFTWNVDDKTLIIIDESQNARNKTAMQTEMMQAATQAKNQGAKILLTSATPGENPNKFRFQGELLGLYNGDDFYTWARQYGCKNVEIPGRSNRNPRTGKQRTSFEFTGDAEDMKHMRNDLMRDDRIAGKQSFEIPGFPASFNTLEVVDMGSHSKKINKAREKWMATFGKLKGKLDTAKNTSNEDGGRMTERQAEAEIAELEKTEIVGDLIQDELDKGNSAVVFAKYKKTIEAYRDRFGDQAVFYTGDETGKDKVAAQEEFQADKKRIIVLSTGTGKASIDLQDLHGNHPRVSFMTPDDNAEDVTQCLGRIPRTAGKTPCFQHVIFAAGTVEEEIASNMKSKIEQLDALTGRDKHPTITGTVNLPASSVKVE